MQPKWEVSLQPFRHRIVCDGEEGEWVTYKKVAILKNFRACTEYWKKVFPVECVFEIVPRSEPAENGPEFPKEKFFKAAGGK